VLEGVLILSIAFEIPMTINNFYDFIEKSLILIDLQRVCGYSYSKDLEGRAVYEAKEYM